MAASACRSRASRLRCRGRSRKSGSSTTSIVHQGDVLYVIDPFDFQVALDTAKAQLRQRAADLQVKRVQAERRQHLTDLATTPEEQQLFAGNATQAQAAFDAAQQQVAQADINLQAHAGAQSGERLCHQSSAAGRRLCPCRHDQHLGDRCRQLLDRRLFRGNQDGACLHRRSRRGGTNGLS